MRPFLSDQLQPLNGPQRGCRSFGVGEVRGINEQKRTVTAILSTPSIDRYGEIILPEAFLKRIDRFKRNPVMLANHVTAANTGASGIIGKWIDIGVRKVPGVGQALVGTCRFMEDDELAESWWQRFRQGMAVAFSVGMIIHAWEARPVKQDKGETRSVRVYTDVELLEVSAVSVPANQDAVVLAASLGAAGRGVPASAMSPDADIAGLLGGSDGLPGALPGASGGGGGLSGRRLSKTLSRSIPAIVQAEVRKLLSVEPGNELHCLIQEVAEQTAHEMRHVIPSVSSKKQSSRVVNHAPRSRTTAWVSCWAHREPPRPASQVVTG